MKQNLAFRAQALRREVASGIEAGFPLGVFVGATRIENKSSVTVMDS